MKKELEKLQLNEYCTSKNRYADIAAKLHGV
jgi:hypothetical protein